MREIHLARLGTVEELHASADALALMPLTGDTDADLAWFVEHFGQPEEEILAALVSRTLGQRPRAYEHVHKAADKFTSKFRKAALTAFKAGHAAINRDLLIGAVTLRSHQGIELAMNQAVMALDSSLREALPALYTGVVEASGKAAAKIVSTQVSGLRAAADVKGFKFDVTNPRAVEWIKQHTADLVADVSETTREAIRNLVEDAFTEQYDVDELADQIEDLVGDAGRADTIARTETIRASNQGQQEAWDQAVDAGLLTGSEQQEWIVTPDDRLCPVCEPLDGVTVGLDESFSVDGDEIDGPPAHPNCRCTVGLVIP
jgi:SPP1 gp7 family putative phage head morphogenesis protein